MKLPELRIKNLLSQFPVIQAGMGVRVGTGKLAGTVMSEGGMGVIASVGLADPVVSLGAGYVEASNRQLIEEIKEARQVCRKGRFKMIDVSHKPIETTAAQVITAVTRQLKTQ